jgi:hypothetical protein
MKHRLVWWWMAQGTSLQLEWLRLRYWWVVRLPEWWRVHVRRQPAWQPDRRWWQATLADRQDRLRTMQALNAPACIIEMVQAAVDAAHAELDKCE